MSFESITLQTQEKYDLAKTTQASPCELENWDSATKLCYVLFANIPFIRALQSSTSSTQIFH